MSYIKTEWAYGDSITPADMNRIEEGVKTMSDKASSSYTKTIWNAGDIVSAEKLNNIENGIEHISELIDGVYTTQTKEVSYTPIESQITDTITKDDGYDFLDEVNVTVNAISNNYVGSNIPRRNSNNVTVVQNPLSVAFPSGYYETSVSKTLDLEPSLVRFIDYDGEILHEYSKSDFLALSSMPSNPSHTGLISQGWNWSLSDAKVYVQEWGYLTIGQLYTTTSGDTEIDINFPQDSIRLSPYLSLAVNGEVDIDWGDNSTHSTVTGSSLTSRKTDINHTYSNPGNYTIKIHVNSGKFSIYCSSYYSLLNNNRSQQTYNDIYSTSVKNVRIGENCVIGACAFNHCYSLQTITIPNTVTFSSSNNFNSCYSLKSITIPDTVTTLNSQSFYQCYSLQSISFSNSLTTISNQCFSNCYSLQSMTVPDTVTSISGDAFYNCYSLNVKILPKYNLKTIINTINISNIDNIFDYMYYNCYPLQSVTINNVVTSISQYAFYGCYSLSSITIPNSVTSINGYAFYNCYSLSSITIPNTVTSIGGYAFYNCYSLQSVTIPNGVTSIDSNAFRSCSSLQSITIPNSVTSISSSSFYGCKSLQSVTIPNGVTSIGISAFEDCYSLLSINIPNSVTSISSSAFYDCHSLSSVTIPSSVTSIKSSAFRSCYSLESITIPSSVTSIESGAFGYCYYMKEYHLKPTVPPTLGTDVFTNIPSDCIIYVPQGSLSAYQSANNWSTYASYMQEENN